MSTARDEVIARIRAAHRAAPPPALDYSTVAREYQTSSELGLDARVELLVDRLVDYKALVRRSSAADVGRTIAAALADRGVATLVAPEGLDQSWLADLGAVDVRSDGTDPGDQLTVAELDTTDAVITGCALAIAETGTLVLDGSAGQGRRVISLIPDYHLCVLRADNIYAGVPQAISRLDPTRPLTLISGPSATSDIELNRVEGVHGPRTLEVIILTQRDGSEGPLVKPHG